MDSQLTPDNINETLTIAPEITEDDGYTGDAFDADGDPLEPESALTDLTGEDAGEDMAAAPEGGDAGPQEASTVEMAELEALRRAKEERDQWQQWYVQAQAAAQQQQAQQHWDGQLAQANQYFAQREQQIYAEAAQAYDAPEFIKAEMTRLNQERGQWVGQYQQARQQAEYQQFAVQQIPAYAQHVAQHYGLGAQAVRELMAVPPDYMPREAARMARERHLFRQLDQVKRTQAAAAVAGNSVAPGGGRATGGRIKAGSRAHLLSLLSQ